jgi:hypothetical protein
MPESSAGVAARVSGTTLCSPVVKSIQPQQYARPRAEIAQVLPPPAATATNGAKTYAGASARIPPLVAITLAVPNLTAG